MATTDPRQPNVFDLPCAALVIAIGAAGSGKSTWLRQHFTEDEVLCLDTYRQMVSGDESDQDATHDAVQALDLVLCARLRRKLTCVIDATNSEAHVRTGLVSAANRFGVPAIAVVFDVPIEVCQARNAQRPGPQPGARWGRRVPDPVIRRQHAEVQHALEAGGLIAEGFADVCVVRPEHHNAAHRPSTAVEAAAAAAYDYTRLPHEPCWSAAGVSPVVAAGMRAEATCWLRRLAGGEGEVDHRELAALVDRTLQTVYGIGPVPGACADTQAGRASANGRTPSTVVHLAGARSARQVTA